MFAYVIGDKKEDLTQVSAMMPGSAQSVVIDAGFDWQGDRRPGIPLHSSVIYELHERLQQTLADVPENLRGTYAALGSPAAIDYLKSSA